MSTINLIDYSKTIELNKATKIRAFNDFICEEFEIENHNTDIPANSLKEMDTDFIVRGLEYYIRTSNISAQNPADTFVYAIQELLEHIGKELDVKNIIITDLEKNKEYFKKAKIVTSKLRSTISKDIASDNDNENLKICVESYLEKHNDLELELNNEIESLITNKRSRLRMYPIFISVIAAKFVMEYGLKSNVIISIRLSDIDAVNISISINNISMPLSTDLLYLLKLYIPLREKLLRHYNVSHNTLIVKGGNGKPYSNRDHASLYLLMHTELKMFKSENYSSKRVLEMLDRGLDISLISKITGFDPKRCLAIQTDNRVEEYCIDKIREFISGQKNVDSFNLDYRLLTCPYCGEERPANIENWVIVKFKGDDEKYVACKNCKGLGNRKYI